MAKRDVVFVVFPHAGGMGASFRALTPFLPSETEFIFLEYPRKRGVLAKTLPDSVQGLAEILIKELRPLFAQRGKKVVFFGYSMGGLVAYEAALLLKNEGRQPDILIAVSMVPPQVQSRGRTFYHLLDDVSFLKAMAKDTGLSMGSVEDEAFRKFLFPFLRREVDVAEKYKWFPGKLLACPILCLYGSQDKIVFANGIRPEEYRKELSLWGEVTMGGFFLHLTKGGHFFLLENPAPGMEVVRRALEEGVNNP